MAVLLLRCVVDASLRHAGRPLAAWLRDIGTQVGAVVHQVDDAGDLSVSSSDSAPATATLVELAVRTAEVQIQATPQQCACIARRIRRAKVPVLMTKVIDTELPTLCAPA